jgi:hypothetical protein
MQHMQDKDFDQLFRDRLEDAEIQPSAGLWNNIQKEIAPKRQRKLPIRWLAAASVAITVTAAIVLNKPEKIQLHGQVAVVDAPKKAAEKEMSTDSFQQAPSTDAAVEPIRSNASASENPAQKEKSLLAMQPTPHDSHLTTMEPEIATTEQPEALTLELPSVETTVAALPKEPSTAVELPVAIDDEATEVEQSGKTRIRNAGDLLNFVVEKLDKRDQKILEFQTDEDDNSSLVAINIGPFKVNTRKHK